MKGKMFTGDEWRDLYERSDLTSKDIFEAIGLLPAVFLRAIQRGGVRIPIPIKYEAPLSVLLKSKILEKEKPTVSEGDEEILTREHIRQKEVWVENVEAAIIAARRLN